MVYRDVVDHKVGRKNKVEEEGVGWDKEKLI